MYSETVPILNMCTALKYIYSKLGIDDFGLNDICDPSEFLLFTFFFVIVTNKLSEGNEMSKNYKI